MPSDEGPGTVVFNVRLALGILATTSILLPSIYQPLLGNIWNRLTSNTVYCSSIFETLWTVICYSAIEPYITYLFMQHPEWRLTVHGEDYANRPPRHVLQSSDKSQRVDASQVDDSVKKPDQAVRSKPKGMRRPSRRLMEGLIYVAPLLLMDLTMIKKFAGVPIEDKLISGNYSPDLASRHSGHFLMPSLHNFSTSSPLQTTRALPTAAPSSRRLTLELVTAFLIYDAVFFFLHLSLHSIPFLRRIHNTHHTHREMHPQITNQLSIAERLSLVLLANFSLNIIGAHVLTRTAFVPIFVWLLVEIHSGLDVAWGYEKILPKGWGSGARGHALHHAGLDGGQGLEPFLCLWDVLLLRMRQPG